MALGYCTACGKLVPIVPRRHLAAGFLGTRWFPVPHQVPRDPEGMPPELVPDMLCPGSGRAIC